jgi:predicted PurR-regulated permease PerM
VAVDQQSSLGFVLTWAVLLAFVVAWVLVWWLAGRANAGLRRQIRVVLVLAAVLCLSLLLYTVFAPPHVT